MRGGETSPKVRGKRRKKSKQNKTKDAPERSVYFIVQGIPFSYVFWGILVIIKPRELQFSRILAAFLK